MVIARYMSHITSHVMWCLPRTWIGLCNHYLAVLGHAGAWSIFTNIMNLPRPAFGEIPTVAHGNIGPWKIYEHYHVNRNLTPVANRNPGSSVVAQWVKCWPTNLVYRVWAPPEVWIFSIVTGFHCTQPFISSTHHPDMTETLLKRM